MEVERGGDGAVPLGWVPGGTVCARTTDVDTFTASRDAALFYEELHAGFNLQFLEMSSPLSFGKSNFQDDRKAGLRPNVLFLCNCSDRLE